MTKHTTYGAEILAHIRQLKEIIPGVRGHHERIDGKGYPDNLTNGDIPIIARIIAVADTFDAMTSDRPYRKALSTKTALEELIKCSGKQCDKDVVAVFTSLFRDAIPSTDL
jgi:HD-GYP domain-containing protein (c-di-GMP phosphodiesterase class II)